MMTKSDLDTIIEQVKQEFRNLLIKRRELITILGNAFEGVVSNPESVCEEIKNSLQEEIAGKIISVRDIERYCPDKWKKKTKPKKDKLSFSKKVEEKPKPPIGVANTGESVPMNETFNNTETYPKKSDGVNPPHDQSEQNGTGTDDNNEEARGDADSATEESMVTHSLNGEKALASKQPEDSGKDRKKEVFVSHIPMSFQHLRKDMETVFQITKGVGNVWFKVSVDLGTLVVKIEFCGNKQQKNVAMTSTGECRILNQAN
jgi:hypothetical protein